MGWAGVFAEDVDGLGVVVAVVEEQGVGEVFGSGHVAADEAGAGFGGFAVESAFGAGVEDGCGGVGEGGLDLVHGGPAGEVVANGDGALSGEAFVAGDSISGGFPGGEAAIEDFGVDAC